MTTRAHARGIGHCCSTMTPDVTHQEDAAAGRAHLPVEVVGLDERDDGADEARYQDGAQVAWKASERMRRSGDPSTASLRMARATRHHHAPNQPRRRNKKRRTSKHGVVVACGRQVDGLVADLGIALRRRATLTHEIVGIWAQRFRLGQHASGELQCLRQMGSPHVQCKRSPPTQKLAQGW